MCEAFPGKMVALQASLCDPVKGRNQNEKKEKKTLFKNRELEVHKGSDRIFLK